MADIRPLEDLMDQLLAENGCPWDQAQSHASLRPYLLEETYEVLEAIDFKDPDLFKEELGDLLYQIVFHARLAQKEGHFDLEEIIQGIVAKMTRRHPHVFGSDDIEDTDLASAWEAIKQKEKPERVGLAASFPKALPALLKAEKFLTKLRSTGYTGPLDPFFPEASPAVRQILESIEGEEACLEVDLSASLDQAIQALEAYQANPELFLGSR